MTIVLRDSKRARERNITRMTGKGLQCTQKQVLEPFKGLVVDGRWKVGADSLNIIIYKREINRKTGKENWRAHSFFATVAGALMELVNQGVRDTELKDLKMVCGKIDQLRRDILKVCGANGEQKG